MNILHKYQPLLFSFYIKCGSLFLSSGFPCLDLALNSKDFLEQAWKGAERCPFPEVEFCLTPSTWPGLWDSSKRQKRMGGKVLGSHKRTECETHSCHLHTICMCPWESHISHSKTLPVDRVAGHFRSRQTHWEQASLCVLCSSQSHLNFFRDQKADDGCSQPPGNGHKDPKRLAPGWLVFRCLQSEWLSSTPKSDNLCPQRLKESQPVSAFCGLLNGPLSLLCPSQASLAGRASLQTF